ncbi:YveK family protein [Bacillus pinisoli]|uniref:YveK family protein n=1 Tax=Bacillus pinisoli TaxID=2901866 RepID=UPI001FF5C816|nr:Wzz/FepE/Etk N-terminal domain-containing protein [Bacillus pinisoli]
MNKGTQYNFNAHGKAKEINLKEYYDIIKKRIWVLVVVTLLFTVAGYFHSIYFKAPPLYQASKRMIIEANAEYMNTLLVLVEDPLVLDKVIDELKLNMSSGVLANQINVSTLNGSQVVKISVTNLDPNLAINIAETTVSIFEQEIAELLGFTNIRLIPETKAEGQIIPIYQDNDRTLLAFGIGVIAGIGLIFLLDSLDNSVRTRHDIEAYLGLPLVGSVSKMNKKNIAPKREEEEEEQEVEIRGEPIHANQNVHL